jgi:hypothetical protein
MPGRLTSRAQQFIAHRRFRDLSRAQRFIALSQNLIRSF